MNGSPVPGAGPAVNPPEPQPVLEVMSLPARHAQYGASILHHHVPSLIWRLALDPGPLAPPQPAVAADPRVREVCIDLVPHPGNCLSADVRRVVSWVGCPESNAQIAGMIVAVAETTRTENAAIALMALFAHDLLGLEVCQLQPIGTRADYRLRGAAGSAEVVVEVSGIHTADYPSESSGRLTIKTDQVLSGNTEGYVSVSTFRYPPDAIVHSYLHFVLRLPPASGRKGRKMKGNRRAQPTRILATKMSQAASIVALDAGSALMRGDTVLARAKYTEAGTLFQRQAPSTLNQSERHLSWLAAASEFFNGGEYKLARRTLAPVEIKFLPPETHELHARLVDQLRWRTADDYAQTVRLKLQLLRETGRWEEMLAVLREHPYVLDRAKLAFLRAHVCHRMRNYPAAAALLGTAYRFHPAVELAVIAAGHVFQLLNEEQVYAAITYSEHLSAEFPHAATFAAASLAWLARARLVDETVRKPMLETQLGFFEKSRAAFAEIRPPARTDHDLTQVMLVAYGSAAMAALQLDDGSRAQTITDEALERLPADAELYVTCGLAARDPKVARAYFERAVSMGVGNYIPYYYLSQDALGGNDLRTARELAHRGLPFLKPEQAGAARYHAFAAGLAASLGLPQEAGELFKKAVTLDPHDEAIRTAYQELLTDLRAPTQWRVKTQELVRDAFRFQSDERLQQQSERRVTRVLQASS